MIRIGGPIALAADKDGDTAEIRSPSAKPVVVTNIMKATNIPNFEGMGSRPVPQ
jgi:hypothetical protein